MNRFALWVGKLFVLIGKIMGRGSSLPGYLALKIAPNFLQKIHYPERIIMVTGTNGKTSVTKYIADFYREHGYGVVSNPEGANMIQGVATTMIKNIGMDFRLRGDVLVLEVDEGFFGIIAKHIVPKTMVITNLFQDQLDRYGSHKNLAEKLAKHIPASTELYLNGDDPMVVYMAKQVSNKVHYFGVAKNHAGTVVEEVCPVCGKELSYMQRIYDHLGNFHCDCGFEHPSLEKFAHDIDGAKFILEGHHFEAPEPVIYMIYNAVAALSVGLDQGLKPEKMNKVLGEIHIGQGRLERIEFNGRESFINLVKNPAGANLSLDLIQQEKEAFDLFFGVNNAYADGKDITWLEKIAFETLEGSGIQKIFVAGEVKDVLASMIEKKCPNLVIEKGEAKDLIEKMKARGLQGYFLSNYTMLAPVREILNKKETRKS